MPVDITFSNGVMDTTVSVVIDSATNVFHIPLLGVYDFIAIDRNEKISDAITDYEKSISTTGTHYFPETNATINVLNTGGTTSMVRIEHNWVRPDVFKQTHPGIKLSDYHYWKVDGVLAPNFLSKATFDFNGSNTSQGHIDNTFITNVEDSLIMYYRAKVADEWQLVNGFTINVGGSHIDKVGNIVIDTLKKGEYTFGIYDYVTNVSENSSNTVRYLFVSPNPSTDTFNISINLNGARKARLRITDANGRLIEENKISDDQTIYQWQAKSQKSGTYFVSMVLDSKVVQTLKMIRTSE